MMIEKKTDIDGTLCNTQNPEVCSAHQESSATPELTAITPENKAEPSHNHKLNRRSDALRANLLKRKQQARARS